MNLFYTNFSVTNLYPALTLSLVEIKGKLGPLNGAGVLLGELDKPFWNMSVCYDKEFFWI